METPPRYLWQDVPEASGQWQLIDTTSSRSIGLVIRFAHCVWYWKRTTVPLFHGVQPAEGRSRTLGQAKSMILKDLPTN